MIDTAQASAAMDDINDVVRRVRQSQIYQTASLIITIWGVLVFAAYIANHFWPRQGYTIWTATDLGGLVISTAVGFVINLRSGNGAFPIRSLISFLLIGAFGVFSSIVLGHFGPRQMIVFWTLYGMLFYAMAGVWFGYAFIVIAACTSALTLIGYYCIGPAFLLWMAVVHGGGLVLGGLWMRRI
ncbi:hypothetical protein HAP47_0008995 [Bradyrhizobium sp. 41S5]|uniref:hypothetical protein n=1 Tax=Bradyrhizobium sp. 41S5 TaxID=1404443 RepID=UPI00156A9E17|nr:hypothetical protein [Bradyrhizobium sp. 41S5]UFX46785.1 hypothetical protein HAP47_0008995 [Bradyrhizobium sp. 41S5]